MTEIVRVQLWHLPLLNIPMRSTLGSKNTQLVLVLGRVFQNNYLTLRSGRVIPALMKKDIELLLNKNNFVIIAVHYIMLQIKKEERSEYCLHNEYMELNNAYN